VRHRFAERKVILQPSARVLAQHVPLELRHRLIEELRRRPTRPSLADPHRPPSAAPVVELSEDAMMDVAEELARHGSVGPYFSREQGVCRGERIFLQYLEGLEATNALPV